MSSTHFICSLIIFSTFFGVDGFNGYYQYTVDQCRFSSFDLSDLEYIKSYVFNKDQYIVFNSTVGKYVGYTEIGVYNAEAWNKEPGELQRIQGEKERYCRNHAENAFQVVLTKTVEPIVKLRLAKPSSGGHPAMLVCSAYSFYPKMIKLTWSRDGKEQTGHTISSEELADGDWYYQVHSHLEFTPKAGEKISCVVEHASLKEPEEFVWDPSMPEPERNKIAIGAAGLVLGIIVTAAGFIYYKTKARGRILVPTN